MTSSPSAATTRRWKCIPFDNNDFLGVHKVLLVQRGIYMLEFLNLAELARRRVLHGPPLGGAVEGDGRDRQPDQPVFVG